MEFAKSNASRTASKHTLDGLSGRGPMEFRLWGMALVYALIAFVSGMIGGGVSRDLSWTALATNAATLVAAFIAVAGLLRLVDMFALRLQSRQQAKRSQALSEEIHGILEAKYPGVTERAKDVDAERLLDQVLSPKK